MNHMGTTYVLNTTVAANAPIGGYFSLELPKGDEYWQNAVRLNLGRNCLRYLIRSYQIEKIFVPSYTCPVVWEAIAAENCKVEYYAVDESFMPIGEFPKSAYILYTNYFGVCAKNAELLAHHYQNIIVDCSQSFFCEKIGLASFNSARKFFGVPDGAYLFTDRYLKEELERDISSERSAHLLLRTDINSQAGYDVFRKNEADLSNENLKTMSNLTQHILKGIDYGSVAAIRRSNYAALNHALQDVNLWSSEIGADDVPMAYPFLSAQNGLREKLINEKIFVATYWSGQRDCGAGIFFEKNLVALPIDQRYTTDDMARIVACIFSNL